MKFKRKTAAPPATPPPNAAVALAELADARHRIIAEGQQMATLRAMARIFEDRLTTYPEATRAATPLAAALAGLRSRIAIFDGMWRQAQPALGLPEPPEITAAEEVALRLQIEAQVAGCAAFEISPSLRGQGSGGTHTV